MRLGMFSSLVLDRVGFRLFAYCSFTSGSPVLIEEQFPSLSALLARYDQLLETDELISIGREIL